MRHCGIGAIFAVGAGCAPAGAAAPMAAVQQTGKALQGHECSLQVSEDELVSTLKHLVSGKLNVPERQQRLLFKGKALADGKRLSDYSIGPNSRLNLVVRPLEKVLLEETLPPTPAAWQLISKVLARHFSAADASRETSLSHLTLDDIQRLAGRFLHPEVKAAMEKGFSKSDSQSVGRRLARPQAASDAPCVSLQGMGV
ncbi:Ubiquitin-like protein 4A [Camelus dromedarius]|uniref:Ubiquitin-like protein 4A n=1 Tax=Camelus dromedarius TaxID=9838 RepID=A0A5N4C4V3_CAMDR|nr:Ubiquitin-like protein 4A [Camelus dromedarius]